VNAALEGHVERVTHRDGAHFLAAGDAPDGLLLIGGEGIEDIGRAVEQVDGAALAEPLVDQVQAPAGDEVIQHDGDEVGAPAFDRLAVA